MTGLIKRTLCYVNVITILYLGLIFFMIINSFINVDAEVSPFETLIIPLMNTVIATCLPLAIIYSETSSGMTKWLMTSPIKVKSYVREKYIVTYFLMIFFGLLSSVEIVIYQNKTTGFEIKQYLLMLSVILGVISLTLSLTLPIMLRASSVAGLSVFAFSLIAVLMVFVIVSLFLSRTQAGNAAAVQLINSDKLVIALVILAAAAAISVISYHIAVRLLKDKQF